MLYVICGELVKPLLALKDRIKLRHWLSVITSFFRKYCQRTWLCQPEFYVMNFKKRKVNIMKFIKKTTKISCLLIMVGSSQLCFRLAKPGTSGKGLLTMVAHLNVKIYSIQTKIVNIPVLALKKIKLVPSRSQQILPYSANCLPCAFWWHLAFSCLHIDAHFYFFTPLGLYVIMDHMNPSAGKYKTALSFNT